MISLPDVIKSCHCHDSGDTLITYYCDFRTEMGSGGGGCKC